MISRRLAGVLLVSGIVFLIAAGTVLAQDAAPTEIPLPKGSIPIWLAGALGSPLLVAISWLAIGRNTDSKAAKEELRLLVLDHKKEMTEVLRAQRGEADVASKEAGRLRDLYASTIERLQSECAQEIAGLHAEMLRRVDATATVIQGLVTDIRGVHLQLEEKNRQVEDMRRQLEAARARTGTRSTTP